MTNFPPHGGIDFVAYALLLALRAHAAQNTNSQGGLAFQNLAAECAGDRYAEEAKVTFEGF